MAIYDLGDAVTLRHEVRVSGTLTNATVSLTITEPDGDTQTPAVSNPSTGVYTATVPATTISGVWAYVWSISGTVVDVVPGAFTVADPAPALYASIDTLKLMLAGRAAGSTTTLAMDAGRDELLLSALNAASRGIDAYTGRRFYADSTASARTYPLRGRIICDADGERLIVDDISTTTGLVVEVGVAGSSTWTAVGSTGYEVGPTNALAELKPITNILRVNANWRTSSITRVRITARWGWPAIPDVVGQAALIQAARLYRRKDSPEGIVGNAEWGTVRLSRIDPDVQSLISHLVVQAVG